jgi:hypothetical protein
VFRLSDGPVEVLVGDFPGLDTARVEKTQGPQKLRPFPVECLEPANFRKVAGTFRGEVPATFEYAAGGGGVQAVWVTGLVLGS